MSYAEEYEKKLRTADEAVKIIKSGDVIDYGYNVGTPDALDKALFKRMPELFDLTIRAGNVLKKPMIFDTENATDHFVWNSIHTSSVERKYMDSGLVFHTPIRYSELPKYYRENMGRNNVAMLQVCPMDEHGYFNFGPNTSHLHAVCEISDVIILEVNENMPRCLGGQETCIHIDEVDMIVEGENPEITTIKSGVPDEDDKTIAGYILEEIKDGCCLQLGIGNTPNALGRMLLDSDLKDLGVHSEMYCDAFMELTKAGKINSSKKNIDKGRQAYAFAAGSKELYEFIDDNPALLASSVDYTNDIARISSIDNFISINSCINFDLYGEVNAESAGFRHISGAGGQMDFVIGAYLSKGGKSFICTKSTFKDKAGNLQSSILPILSPGTVVTSTRANVQYLVTEYGKVNLKGKSTWERAEMIVSIAHPDFRDELIKEAEKMKIWRKSNKR